MPPDVGANPKEANPSPIGFRSSQFGVPVWVWGVILAVSCLHGLVRPGNHSTYPCFRREAVPLAGRTPPVSGTRRIVPL